MDDLTVPPGGDRHTSRTASGTDPELAAFALGDYEWMLAFEADELYRIVDLMRHLRGSETRRHVREEVPFYTGSLAEVADLVDRLP